MRALADRAGVPTATIYQFFPDRETLLQALAIRYVAATPGVIAGGLSAPAACWPEALAHVIDAFADELRRSPAMRTLWLAGVMDAATARIAADADDVIAERLRASLCDLAGGEPRGSAAEWRYLVTLAGDLIRRAFKDAPGGDPFLLEGAKLVTALYAAELLGESGEAPGASRRDPESRT